MSAREWTGAAAEWLTAKSTRVLRIVLATSVGVAATLWQLSPWSTNSTIGQILFWIAVGALLLLLTEWPVRLWMRRRAVQSLVPKRAILRGSYIERVVDIGRSVMGDGHANADTMRDRLARCPDGVHVLVRRSNRARVSDEVVGYLACWTLSAEALARFLTGEYRSALDLQDDDLVTDAPAAAYITMLYGSDPVARRAMIATTIERLRELFSTAESPSMLLARPATHDGEMLMKKTGMKPIHSSSNVVWYIDRATLLDKLAGAPL
ncbi:hypothetical protein ACLBXX_00505 [Microbacterium sp. C23T]